VNRFTARLCDSSHISGLFRRSPVASWRRMELARDGLIVNQDRFHVGTSAPAAGNSPQGRPMRAMFWIGQKWSPAEGGWSFPRRPFPPACSRRAAGKRPWSVRWPTGDLACRLRTDAQRIAYRQEARRPVPRRRRLHRNSASLTARFPSARLLHPGGKGFRGSQCDIY